MVKHSFEGLMQMPNSTMLHAGMVGVNKVPIGCYCSVLRCGVVNTCIHTCLFDSLLSLILFIYILYSIIQSEVQFIIRSYIEQVMVYDLLQLLEAQPFPALQDLLLNVLGIGALKVCSLPVLTSGILCSKESIANNLAALEGIRITVAHVRDKLESLDIIEENLIGAGTTTSCKGPHDILFIIDVNVIADENETVDGKAGLLSKDNITDLFSKGFTIGLHSSQALSIDLESNPGGLADERSERIGDGEVGVLTELADLSSSKVSNHSLLAIS